jgi:lipase
VTYRVHDVPTGGGTLRVGEWGPDDPSVATVVAVHGITASHLAWAVIAEAMPHVRLIAPDLRGRGRSAGLPGPYGMARHAADLEAVIEALELPRAILLGHSMGAFVAVVAASRYPDRFSEVFLIDGGLPLAIPAGMSKEDLVGATIGSAVRRLSMTFRIGRRTWTSGRTIRPSPTTGVRPSPTTTARRPCPGPGRCLVRRRRRRR